MSQHSNLARCLQYIEFEVTVIYSTKYITYRGRDGGTRSFTLDKSSRSSTYGINVIRQFSQRPRDPVLQDNTEPLACHAAQLSLVPLGNHALPPAWPLEASIWITTGWRVVRIGGVNGADGGTGISRRAQDMEDAGRDGMSRVDSRAARVKNIFRASNARK